MPRHATPASGRADPRRVAEVAGYESAARYIPAEGRVAGDWFDVAQLPSGGFLVGVGDVGGHGLPAASLMLQLRNPARALATQAACRTPGRCERAITERAHRFRVL
jgi:serine phosphatase RsbU (regulator of sigma subunit)